MGAAALDAGGGFAHRLYSRQLGTARGAAVEIFADGGATREREVVRALFISKAEVATCLAPLGAVRLDATSPGAVVGEQMGELVAESAVYFLRAELRKPRV